ncbi:tRNA(5-methylaminomethyl-2-thiouridylate) methyltransferase [uncultured Desulfovibrio sp.]|uniref:tRNA(5-methylaminomethyl-2-thiouridylate) methyltransferase n=1 Tax=uncultured Desulfovibrio sp. TaxID=167968 RepID=UPI00263155F8|nr:tRNA(5-methylaminomethyl-2-thiouridylate) methyltransferase [uncultured Desulfovibrio sp.]
MIASPDVIVLFSGGLDSILAARVLEEQGLRVRCLHCVSPFFGDAAALPRWKRLHGLDIVSLDVSADFAALLRRRPEHGFGKVMNPCVDCKILLLRHARLYMESVGARLLATGEVLGQRPMSQRRDTLRLIPREAEVDGLLLRPLCARLLPPIPAEENGLVDRSRLLGISGRGRGEQLALAARFGLREIPTPGGGCRLTERENARRYWPVLTHCAGDGETLARDFALANLGRQFWRHLDERQYWLAVGRNNADNKRLAAAAGPEDALISLTGLPGPLSLARAGAAWPRALLEEAAALTASYAPKAVAAGGLVLLRAAWRDGGLDLAVPPQRAGTLWLEPSWEDVRTEIRKEARLRREAQARVDA